MMIKKLFKLAQVGEKISRRELLLLGDSLKSLLPLLGLSVVANSCKRKVPTEVLRTKEQVNQGQNNGGDDPNGVISPPDSPPAEDPIVPGGGDEPAKCPEKKNEIDWNAFTDAKENLEPKFKFYGSYESAMIVVDLPKYQHGSLVEMFLVQTDGTLLAQKGISEAADIYPDTRIRPIVFDNINIKDQKQLVIIFKIACNTCAGGFEYVKRKMQYAISFTNKFLGKTVYSLTAGNIPEFYEEHQAAPRFGPDPESYDGYFNVGLYSVANEDIFFKGSDDLKGYVIADLMGNIISQEGEDFNNLLKYNEFFCYKLVNNQFYIRTFYSVM